MRKPSSEDQPGWIFRRIHKVEDVFLALLLGAMIVLAPLQIFLRNFFDTGIGWADPLLRVLLLWVGLMGAVAASRSDSHIRIDVASRLLPPKVASALGALTGLFTAGVAGLVAWHSWRFVYGEWEFGGTAFSGVPAWMFEVVIPVAFGFIAIRYGFRAMVQIRALVPGTDAEVNSAPNPKDGASS
ncbi:MAG TPA: TRAP transporter small permease [Myxococcales bacterium]|nr:TRAP transporter small permease [Myxococcales bacterium]HIL02807.1 TRAP transporter small permease [Myxococcales bacterium]